MNSKEIQRAISSKTNGIELLKTKFGFPSQDDLFTSIKNDFPSSSDYFIRKLKQQSKKHPVKSKKSRKQEKSSTSDHINFEITYANSISNFNSELCENCSATETSYEEEPVSPENTFVESTAEITPAQEENTTNYQPDIHELEELQCTEQNLSSKVYELEVAHKDMVSQRRKLVQKFALAKNALEELRRLLNIQEQKVTTLYSEYIACAESMEEKNNERKLLVEELEEVRNKISALQKITILVYSNATIDVENAEIPDIPEEDIITVLIELSKNPETGNFTINELKAIARLQKMVKTYTEAKLTFEIAFDNPELESFWKKFNA